MQLEEAEANAAEDELAAERSVPSTKTVPRASAARAGHDPAAESCPCRGSGIKRVDALFAVEREINSLSAAARLAARQERSATLVAGFEAWVRAERAKLSRHAAVAKGDRLHAHALGSLRPIP
jgi:hypothetical protein